MNKIKKIAEDIVSQFEVYQKSEHNEPPELIDGFRYPPLTSRVDYVEFKIREAIRISMREMEGGK